MNVIKFKDFFETIEKNYQLPATVSASIKLNDKEKMDVKIGTNTNKFILELDDELDLIDLFCLNFNSMTNYFITPINLNISSKDLATVTESIVSSLDGVSTHLVKFPEASRAAGQLFSKNSKVNHGILAVDSTTDYFGKEKIYAQNASTMKFARPFSSEFLFNGKIISYLEVFSNLQSFPVFEQFAKKLFNNFLITVVDKSNDVISGVIDIVHENTIINIPVNGQYISTSPISSAKILNALQYSNYFLEDHTIKNLRLSVGGANPQNAADYLSNISGSQKLLISIPPQISITNQAAKNYLFKFNHGFEKSIVYSGGFIRDSLKDPDYVDHINNILRIAYSEKIENFEINILEKSIFIDNLINYKLKDINHVIDNYYFMLSKINAGSIKYNENLIHLVNIKTKLTKLPEDSDVNIKLNEFIVSYEKNTVTDLKNIENGIVQDIKNSIEYDFAKHIKNEHMCLETGFSKFLSGKIHTLLFGVK
jgi:hypothetical protein